MTSERDKSRGGDRERVPRPFQEIKLHPGVLRKNFFYEMNALYSTSSSTQFLFFKRKADAA